MGGISKRYNCDLQRITCTVVMGRSYLLWKNGIIMYLSITLDAVIGANSLRLLESVSFSLNWDKNLRSHMVDR